jgi:hypothetical protein
MFTMFTTIGYIACCLHWHLFKMNINTNADYLDFPIMKFPFLRSNIPETPAYGVCIYHVSICSYDIRELEFSIMMSLVEGWHTTRHLQN